MDVFKHLSRVYLTLGFCLLLFNSNLVHAQDSFCSDGHLTFELITGFVLTSSSEFMTMVPGTLQLTDCIEQCRTNATCKAINFETGLCVLLTTNQQDSPLSVSQFPVFTLYAEKICLPKVKSEHCRMAWAFEKVANYELKNYEKKSVKAISKEDCLEQCVLEQEFQCRSVNFNNQTQTCSMSHLDRHSVPSSNLRGIFTPVDGSNVDYYETNCIKEPSSLCDFKQIKGKMLKTVDSVYQNVSTIEECQEICLKSKYRCFSYDIGDPNDTKKVCRTSHLDSASLTHIEEPYVSVKEAVTYQRLSCYNVTISCHAKEMSVRIQTNKLFNGKVYSKTKPNSCMNDVVDSLDFDLVMPYNDLLCDVRQKEHGKFTNDIVIQHHDMIVTTKDLGLALNCNYDLTNRSISNVNSLNVNGDFENREEHNIHSATVGAPNVTMKITDRNGNDISTAQVGDPLSLRFEFVDKNTPYQMFIRELVAVDGVDSAEILLIDGHGCPTDSSIMSNIIQKDSDSIHLEAPFDAFKFPLSEIVVFKALVTPCLSACEPAKCDVRTYDNMIKTLDSFGRRRKRSIAADALGNNSSTEEELIVMQTIKIMDSFHPNSTKKRTNKLENMEGWEWSISDTECTSLFTIIMVCSLFLIGQLLIICVFTFIWNRKQTRSQFKHKRQLLNSADLHSLSNFTTSSTYSLDYSTGRTLPRAQLIYSNPYNNSTISSMQQNKSPHHQATLRSTGSNNQVPNFIMNKNMSKLNSHLFNHEPASTLYNTNLFN